MDCTQNNQETIILPPALKVIEANAFSGRRNLKSIVIPDSVEEIGEDAFMETGVEEIIFPRELRKLGIMNGFYPSLRKLDFSKVTKLEVFPSCFLSIDMPELKELALPYGVKKIGEAIGGNAICRLFFPPTVEEVGALYQSDTDIFCFSPGIKSLLPIVEDFEPDASCRLLVLPAYVAAYRSQRDAEGISEKTLIIDVIPEEYRHYYD